MAEAKHIPPARNIVQLLKTPSRQAAAARKRPAAAQAAILRNPNNLAPKPSTKDKENDATGRVAAALLSPAAHAREAAKQVSRGTDMKGSQLIFPFAWQTASPAPIRGEPAFKGKKTTSASNPFLIESTTSAFASAEDKRSLEVLPSDANVEESEPEEPAEKDREQPDASETVKEALDRLSLDESENSQAVAAPVDVKDQVPQGEPGNSDAAVEFDIPLRDESDTPARTPAVEPKTVFSPSSLTFAALPARDPLRGRSIGASKHHRLTLATNAAQEKDAAPVEGPVASIVESAPVAGPSTQARSAKVRSSWLRHAIAAAGGEEGLRKSVAASVVMQTKAEAKEEAPRSAEVPSSVPSTLAPKPPAQRFTLLPGSKPVQAQAPAPVEQPANLPQSNLSRMIATLQEKKAAAAASQPARAPATAATGSMLEVGLGPSSNKLNAGSWNALRGTASTSKNVANTEVEGRERVANRRSSSRRSDSSTEEADEQRDNSSHRDFVTAQQTIFVEGTDSPDAQARLQAQATEVRAPSAKPITRNQPSTSVPARPSLEQRTSSSSSNGKTRNTAKTTTPPNTPPKHALLAFFHKTAPARSRPSVQVATVPAKVTRNNTVAEMNRAPAKQAGDRGMTMSQALSVGGDSDDDSDSEDELALKPEVSMHEDLEEAVAMLAKGMKLSSGANEPVEEVSQQGIRWPTHSIQADASTVRSKLLGQLHEPDDLLFCRGENGHAFASAVRLRDRPQDRWSEAIRWPHRQHYARATSQAKRRRSCTEASSRAGSSGPSKARGTSCQRGGRETQGRPGKEGAPGSARKESTRQARDRSKAQGGCREATCRQRRADQKGKGCCCCFSGGDAKGEQGEILDIIAGASVG